MTIKLKKIFTLVLAVMMLILVSVSSFAEDTAPAAEEAFVTEAPTAEPTAEPTPEVTQEPTAEPTEEPTPEPVQDDEPAETETTEETEEADEDDEDDESFEDNDFLPDEDGLYEIGDEWGSVDSEVIAKNTPEMTPEFIFADDPEWLAENGYPVPEEDEQEAETEDAAEAEADTEDKHVKVVVVATLISENEMKLSAVVEGSEEGELSFQWQVSEDGGNSYSDIADANGADYEVILNEENMHNFWRVKVDLI